MRISGREGNGKDSPALFSAALPASPSSQCSLSQDICDSGSSFYTPFVAHLIHKLEELVQQCGDEGLDGSHLLLAEGIHEAAERHHGVNANLGGAESVRQGFEQGFE